MNKLFIVSSTGTTYVKQEGESPLPRTVKQAWDAAMAFLRDIHAEIDAKTRPVEVALSGER